MSWLRLSVEGFWPRPGARITLEVGEAADNHNSTSREASSPGPSPLPFPACKAESHGATVKMLAIPSPRPPASRLPGLVAGPGNQNSAAAAAAMVRVASEAPLVPFERPVRFEQHIVMETSMGRPLPYPAVASRSESELDKEVRRHGQWIVA